MTRAKSKTTARAILIVVCVSVCGLAATRKQAQTTQKPPQVSAEFQTEVTRLRAIGLKLIEALPMSLEGNAHHLAAIFRRDKPKDPSQTCEFRLLEWDGSSSKTIFRRNDFFFTFDLGDAGQLNGTDINKDGVKEVIVQSSSG